MLSLQCGGNPMLVELMSEGSACTSSTFDAGLQICVALSLLSAEEMEVFKWRR